jgi:hypothetical protein
MKTKLKKSSWHEGDAPSRPVHAKIEELGDWRGKMEGNARREIDFHRTTRLTRKLSGR